MGSKKLKIFVEGAMMIALATVLSLLKVWQSPYGGSVTLEMLPLIVMGMRHGLKYGCLTGFVHGCIQLFLGFENVGYCNGLLAQMGCILLDYVVAFTVLGCADLFTKSTNKATNVIMASVGCGILRYLCSFLSGWLLWGSYAWEGWNPCLYSVVYNAIYMVPSIIIVTIVLFLISKTNGNLIEKQN